MEKDLTITPVALIFALIAGSLMLFLPRRSAIVPLMFAIVFIPLHERVIIASLDFFILRILVIFGWLRIIIRSEYFGLRINTIDKLLVLWVVSGVAAYTLLWQTSGALINRLGVAFDIIGIYFLIRFLVRDYDDIEWVIKTFAVISIPVALAMVVEWRSERNLFSIFGGVSEYTLVREGKLRCLGAFSHPITAGSFGASLLPLFIALRKARNGPALMVFGAAAATVITYTTSSSGPFLAYIAGIFGLMMWHFRQYMRPIRWAVFLTLVALHFSMKAPVWALMMKVQVFGASTGYHRYHLIDQFVNRFSEWWLVGVRSTADWGYYLFDVTNHFVRVGVDGGLVTLVLFILIIAYSFQTIGRSVKIIDDPVMQRIIWGLGASLFVHVVAFMGVSYFDQIKVVLYMVLAMISVVRSNTEEMAAAPESTEENAMADGRRSAEA